MKPLQRRRLADSDIANAIDLWRVLHARRDIPEWLSEITE